MAESFRNLDLIVVHTYMYIQTLTFALDIKPQYDYFSASFCTLIPFAYSSFRVERVYIPFASFSGLSVVETTLTAQDVFNGTCRRPLGSPRVHPLAVQAQRSRWCHRRNRHVHSLPDPPFPSLQKQNMVLYPVRHRRSGTFSILPLKQ